MSRTGEYHWTFGDGCHISFPNGGDPIAEPPHAFTSREGCAAISDTAGNLLFYTDGVNLYDATNTTPINGAVPLGGHSSSTNSAIVVPPAGGGSLYHLFTVGTWSDATNNNAVLHYTPVAEVSGKVSIPGLGPAQDVIDPTHGNKWLVSESIGATSHVDCDKYWVVCLDANNEEWVSILMASDLGPLPANMIRSAYAAPSLPSNAYGMRISADGKFIAHANAQSPPNVSTIDIFNLDRSSGAVTYHSQISELGGGANPYGLEFSNNSEHLYFTDWARGTIHRHTMGSDATLAQCAPIYDHAGRVGALQLGPNGKIYATKYAQSTLISIDNPNATLTSSNPLTDQAQNMIDVGFQLTAQAAGGGALTFTANASARLGLPMFTRIADDCVVDPCETIAAEVNNVLSERMHEHHNEMPPCDADAEWKPTIGRCEPLDLPAMSPDIKITWGDSICDCIESDDTEVMTITVCNPYSNIDYSSFTILKLEVVDGTGNPVASLPDGTPSVQLTPIGPHCFGAIERCTCISREFVLRNRGALAGEYRIRVTGICFDIHMHDDATACFKFDICED